MSVMQKVATQAPEVYDFLLKTAEEIKESPFRDDIIEEMDSIIKQAEGMLGQFGDTAGAALGKLKGHVASVGKALGPLKGPAAAMGGLMAGGIAMNLAGDLYDAARRGLTKGRNYKQMLEANPDLDPSDPSVKSSFETLHRFNPEFSSDPYVAGAWIRSQQSYGADLAGVKDLAQSRKNIRDSRSVNFPSRVPWSSPADRELQQAQINKAKADTFKARQDGQSAYNRRMGMLTPEEASGRRG